MIRIIRDKIFEEIVFFIALALAVLTGFFSDFHFEAIDFNVIWTLTALMLVTLAFEKYQLLDSIAIWVLNKVDSERKTALLMMAITAALAMFITNDVALITVVPITITLSSRAGFDPFRLVVLEAIAANIGSSLTPFGNPQNLFLYNQYQYSFITFITTIAPFVIMGLMLSLVPVFFLSNRTFEKMHFNTQVRQKKWVGLYLVLFLICVALIVLRRDVLWIMTVIALVVFFKDRELIKLLDYFLLGTFVCFFIFVDHMNQLGWVNELVATFLGSDQNVFLVSAGLSQIISNVPAAILLSSFVSEPGPLLIGVSVGGLGTMIASLANLIAYKYYAKQYETKRYHRYFLVINMMMLGFFLLLYSLLL